MNMRCRGQVRGRVKGVRAAITPRSKRCSEFSLGRGSDRRSGRRQRAVGDKERSATLAGSGDDGVGAGGAELGGGGTAQFGGLIERAGDFGG